MNYGGRSNAQLLLSYGFCLHPNPFDRFTVALAAEGADVLAPGPRAALLRSRSLSRRGSLSLAHPLPPSLLATLRVCLAPDADVYAAHEDDAALTCARNEARVIASLRGALRQALRAVECEGDAALLSDEACAARSAVRVGTSPHGQAIWGCEAPEWTLAAYRHGQAAILRAALVELSRHAAETLIQSHAGDEAPALAGEHMQRYAAWLHESGVQTPALTAASVAAGVAYAPGGGWAPPSLVLSSDAPAGARLAHIPAACVLRASDDDVVNCGGDEEMALACAALAHTAQDDEFAPLLGPLMALPAPVDAACAVAPILCGTTAANAAEAEAEEAASRADALASVSQHCDAAPGGAAWALALARHMCVPLPPRGAPCLVPVAHALAGGTLLGALCDARAVQDGGVELIALAPLRAGTALAWPTGRADAATLLIGEARPEPLAAQAGRLGTGGHALELMLAPQEDDPHADEKSRLLDALGVAGAHYLSLTLPDSLVRPAVCTSRSHLACVSRGTSYARVGALPRAHLASGLPVQHGRRFAPLRCL